MERPIGPVSPPSVVLDTNVVLDWLVFRDPGVVGLAQAIETGRIRWLTCPRMREELARVLRYPALGKWNLESDRTLTCFDRWSTPCPNAAPSPTHPSCSDAHDQIFIDLALSRRARWLVTHDRALLKLARPALARGVEIITPVGWPPC
jgi:putative PIN family toxin of toxin-antitoxin system